MSEPCEVHEEIRRIPGGLIQYRKVCATHNHGITPWQAWVEKSQFVPLDLEPTKIVTLRIGTSDYNPAEFPFYTPYYETLPVIIPPTPPQTPTTSQPQAAPSDAPQQEQPQQVTRLPPALTEPRQCRKGQTKKRSAPYASHPAS